jgi:plastocyanin
MTERLDSRALRHTDTYGQRFMRPGTYRYAIAPAGLPWRDHDFPYAVHVTERGEPRREGDDMQQVDVSITSDCEGLRPDQHEVTISEGDLVLWHSPDATDSACAVVGEKGFFGNDPMTNECGYSHVFTTPGEHHWRDANGSGLSGVVRVIDPEVESKRAFGAWQRQLREGTLVLIHDGKVEPAEVEIVLGQTVFFAIVTSEGVTVTADEILEPSKVKDVLIEPTWRLKHLAGASFFRPA